MVLNVLDKMYQNTCLAKSAYQGSGCESRLDQDSGWSLLISVIYMMFNIKYIHISDER